MPTLSKRKVIPPAEKSLETIAYAIDKIAIQLSRKLKAALEKDTLGQGRREFGFKVVVNGPQIDLHSIPAVELDRDQFDPIESGRQAVSQMQKAEGGALDGGELLRKFKLTSANLHKRRSEHRIVAWRDAKHHFYYPQWQFTEAGALLAGVQDVLEIFHSSDEWRVMRYFLTPRRQLDDLRPLDLLRAGEVEKVIAHARANAEENSW